ncbi:hypothetical protein [Corynebacterium halotolerans]|uniref:hypothetical protein n=1 Tax=Corynebacterium halotolerans TaxID=225326 RepID=UPI003CEB906F
MSTITLDSIGAAQVPEDEQVSTERNWISQAPLATLAACASALVLYMNSRRES